MQRIEAIIRQRKLDDVKAALAAAGVTGMTVTDVKGFGRQRGRAEVYRGAEYQIEFVPKVRIEIAVGEPDCARIVDTIVAAARTGKVGDGKIFISTLPTVVRIRTGEINVDAL